MIPNLDPLFAMKDDSIYQIGDPNSSSNNYAVYFTTKGVVDLLGHTLMQLKTVLVKITAGNYFGELDLLFEEKHTQQARAAVNCELLALDRSCFFDLCIDYPAVKDEILAEAQTRLLSFKETREIASRMLESSSKMQAKFSFQPSTNYEPTSSKAPESLSQSPAIYTHQLDTGYNPCLRRQSYCIWHLVSKRMNSRSRLALRTDARILNDKQSFEMMAVIGEVGRKVDSVISRMDIWENRWNEIEGLLSLFVPNHMRPNPSLLVE